MIKERIKSLDVYRGAVMAAMLLVENPGSWNAFPVLKHAVQGEAITPTDFIFPLFIYIMGIAVPLSLSKWRNEKKPGKLIFARIARRTIILFALGVFLGLYPHFNFSRFALTGVLQRIAVIYLITSIIYLKMKTRTIVFLLPVLLLVYWGMITLTPVAGFTPPGFNREHNFVTLVDKIMLGRFSASGILSTIPAVVTGLLGVLSGILILSNEEKLWKFRMLMLAGTLAAVLGILWGTVFSIEKDLWTSSYTLYTGGIGVLLFGLFYWIIDIKGIDKWTEPFLIYGTNCITVYFFSHLLAYTLWHFTVTEGTETLSLLARVMNLSFNRWFEPQIASLLFSLLNLGIWFIPLLIMYRKRIIIKF